MAFNAGKFNPVVYNFSGGQVTVYAPNRDYAVMALHLAGVLQQEDGGSSVQHTPAKTKHKTLGQLVSITLP